MAFKSEKLITTSLGDIEPVARDIEEHFLAGGYQVDTQSTDAGSWTVDIHQGGRFKAIVGLKTALKIILQFDAGGIRIYAGIGIFGRKAAPMLVGMAAVRAALAGAGAVVSVVGIPLLLAQAWGLIKQSKLDSQAITVAQRSIRAHETLVSDSPATPGGDRPASDSGAVSGETAVVANCGNCMDDLSPNAAFCGGCGVSVG